jgi:hypothetical protein
MSRYLAGLLGVLLPLAGLGAQEVVAPCPPETIPAAPAAEPPPPASIHLGLRHGHAVPSCWGHSHTGAGNIDVAQPSPDTVTVTMTGVAAAGANPCKDSEATVSFDLCQDLEVRFDSPKLKKAKLVLEARVIGLLRSACKGGGTAQEGPGCATVDAGGVSLVRVCAPEHAVASGEKLSINDHDGPFEVPIGPGKYVLHQTFTVSATYPRTWCPGKAVAEFGSDSGLDKLWISSHDLFSGASTKDFGLQVTLKVVEDTGNDLPAAAPEKEAALRTPPSPSEPK